MNSLRATALPLALLTAVGMLATDLYLPAVPSIAAEFGGSVEKAQWTLSSFLACLAGTRAGQGSGLLLFLAFGVSAAASAGVAPFLERSLLPLSWSFFTLLAISIAICPVTSIWRSRADFIN